MTKLFLLHDHPLCPVPCVSRNHHRPFCISPWLLHISVSRNHFHIVLDVIFVQWFGMKLNVQAFSEVPLLCYLFHLSHFRRCSTAFCCPTYKQQQHPFPHVHTPQPPLPWAILKSQVHSCNNLFSGHEVQKIDKFPISSENTLNSKWHNNWLTMSL